jgi:hypothetical protein
MNTGQGKPDDVPGAGDCTTCGLGELEKLKGTAKRFGRQAEVMSEVSADLEKFSNSYADARQKYTAARTAADLEIKAIRVSLGKIREQLKCGLDADQNRCMQQAADKVFAEIEECSGPPGCQSPCDSTPAPDPDREEDLAALTAEIARRRDNLAASALYFAGLVAEPGEIAKRVEKLKTDTDALLKQGGVSDPADLYATWLILDHWADPARIGHGFASVSAYLDCMCSVLTCLVFGWTTVATLEGRKAELEGYEAAKRQACQKKKDDPLTAIRDAYERCCRSEGTDKSPTDQHESVPTDEDCRSPQQEVDPHAS